MRIFCSHNMAYKKLKLTKLQGFEVWISGSCSHLGKKETPPSQKDYPPKKTGFRFSRPVDFSDGPKTRMTFADHPNGHFEPNMAI